MQRYMETYLKPYPGYYYTGDAVRRDEDGHYWITGRVDDVINVAGHRIGTAEIEGILDAHEAVAEAAVVGVNHDVKGQSVFAYVTLMKDHESADVDTMVKELKAAIRKEIGGFAAPDHILVHNDLPKTRSGKIMRRILRKIASKEYADLGDTSTLNDPAVVDQLIEKRQAMG